MSERQVVNVKLVIDPRNLAQDEAEAQVVDMVMIGLDSDDYDYDLISIEATTVAREGSR